MLFKLNTINTKEQYQKVKRVSLHEIGWKELDLQNLLSKNIFDLISSTDLMAIFTERRYQEEPDILAIDKNGDLYIFELKRWSSNSENLLQVLRYGQLFGGSNYEELNDLYKKYEKQQTSELLTDHKSYFNLNEPLKRDDFNGKQHFLVVVNGLDQKTIEAILYWKNNGLNIDAIVYWVFEIAGNYYIEFNMYSPIENLLEYEASSYVLNTNINNNPTHTEDMLSKQKAAAYWPGWREKIQKLQKDDLVFLYKSGTGIIAYGYADGKLHKAECDGHPDYEYFMKLNKFIKLKNPISAATMKEIAGQGFPFRTTMFSLSEEVAKKFFSIID